MAERTLMRDVTLTTVAAVLTAATAWFFFTLGRDNPGPREEEERPPIIVNNGSLKFTALSIGNASEGYWSQSGDTWSHVHDKKGSDKMTVFVGGVTDLAACGAQEYKNVEKLELTTTSAHVIKVDILKTGPDRNLQVVLPSGYRAVASGALLTVGEEADKLSVIKLLKDSGGEIATCPVGANPLLFLRRK